MPRGTGGWTVRIEGLDAANRKLRRLKKIKTLNSMAQSFHDAAETVHHAAKQEVPVVTGDLRRSMKFKGSRLAAWVKAGNKSP